MAYGVITVFGSGIIDDLNRDFCALYLAGADGVFTKDKAVAGLTAIQLVVVAPMVRLCVKLGVQPTTDPVSNGVYISEDGITLYDYFEFLDKLMLRLEGPAPTP